MKRRTTIAAALMLGFAASACGSGGGEAGASASGAGETVTVAVATQAFESLDPQMSASPPTDTATRLMYEGLLAPGEGGSVEPLLATKWANPADRIWTFTLRDGVTFHDGSPLDAEAVAASFNHIIDPAAKKTRSSEFSRVERVVPTGRMTVRFELTEPWPTLPNELAYAAGAVVSKSAVEDGVDLTKQSAGTGPYRLEGTKDGTVTLARFDDYWGEASDVSTMELVPVSAENTRVQMLQSGQADVAMGLPISSVKGIESSDSTQVVADEGGLVMHLGLNQNYEPFSHVEVRRALNMAIDRQAIIDTTLGGHAVPADSYLAPTVQGHAAQEPYAFDPDAARDLLAEAGYADGFDMTLTVPSGRYPGAAEMAQAVQGFLGEVGIRTRIETVDFGAEIDAITKPAKENEVQAYLLGWQAATAEPSLVSNIVFRSTAFPPDSWNTMFYANPDVDGVLDKADVEADDDARAELYAQAQALVWDDAPWVFLAVPDNLVGAKRGVSGIRSLADGTLMLHDVS